MRPAFPVSEYYDGSAPCAPFSGPRAYPDATSLAGPPAPGPRHTRFPRSLCFDQQAWRPALLLRSRHGYAVDIHRDLPGQTCETLPGVPPPAKRDQRGTHRPPAHIHRIRAGQLSRSFTTPVPCVHPPVSLTEPDPSGSTGPTRLRRGCSHPPQRPLDQAAASFTNLPRQASSRVLSPPLETTPPRGAPQTS